MKILFDSKKCTGCSACQMACLDQRDIQTVLGQKPLRYVEIRENPIGFFSVGCVHCGKCMTVCPEKCIERNDLGFVVQDLGRCIGCGACASACPLNVISISPETGKAVKCDGCSERVRAGLLPACVHTCPTGALTLQE